MQKLRTLLIDIENTAILGYAWGKYEQNLIGIVDDWYMLSFAYQWLDEGPIKVRALPDFEMFKRDKKNDYALVKELWALFDEADIIIGHNGDAFDIKKANARFLFHGMKPPSPYRSIDTLKLAKKYFKMTANRLDDIGAYLGVGRKIINEGWPLWKACMEGDLNAWKRMKAYNKQDVKLLSDIYMALRPWMKNHPNMNVIQFEDDKRLCPACGSDKVQKRGFEYTQVSKYQRYQCRCGKWSRGPAERLHVTIR